MNHLSKLHFLLLRLQRTLMDIGILKYQLMSIKWSQFLSQAIKDQVQLVFSVGINIYLLRGVWLNSIFLPFTVEAMITVLNVELLVSSWSKLGKSR